MSYTIREENTIATNRLIIRAQIIKFGLLLLYFHFIDLTSPDGKFLEWICEYIFLPFYVLIFVSCLAVRRNGLEKKSSYCILIGGLMLSSLMSYVIFTRFVILFLIIPLIISTRTFRKKESHLIALLMWLGYICADVLNIYLEQVSPMFRLIHWNLIGDMWQYPSLVVKFQIVPTTLVFALTVIITDSINKTGRSLIKRLVADTSRMAVIDSELALASDIQRDILPPGHFNTPDGRVIIDAAEKPAREVCGDFYDYFMIDENHLAVMVADISDKGVSAAMFMMKSHTILSLVLKTVADLSEAVNISNNLIREKNSNNFFLTAWIGILNLTDNTVEFVNCGHPMPVLYNNVERKAEKIESEPNIILGCFENAVFHADRIRLSEGDSLVLYTDGITDILNEKNESFSEERLLDTVSSCGITGPDELIAKCEEFAGSVPVFDDMTVLTLHL